MNLHDRFLAKTEPCPTTGCWLWTAGLMLRGYARFSWDGRTGLAHRYAYEHYVAPIPADMEIDHICRNRFCVNPDHLDVVTARENTRRGRSPASVNAAKTHCKNGHEFTPENTYIVNDSRKARPARVCRTCRLATMKQYQQRKADALG